MSDRGSAVTLTEFLLARIAEDEQAVRAASPGPWQREQNRKHLDPWTIFGHSGTIPEALTHVASVELGWRRDEDAAHIARWDPSRVLAECEAKRRIVAAHSPTSYLPDGDPQPEQCRGCGSDHPCLTLRSLALPYAAHPDYDPEWLL